MRTIIFLCACLVCLLAGGCASSPTVGSMPSSDSLDQLFQARSEVYLSTTEVRIANHRGDIASFGKTSMDDIRTAYAAGQEKWDAIVATLLLSVDANSKPNQYQATLDKQIKDMQTLAKAVKDKTAQVKYKDGRAPQIDIKDPWTALADNLSKTIVEIWKETGKRLDDARARVTKRLEDSKLPSYSKLPAE